MLASVALAQSTSSSQHSVVFDHEKAQARRSLVDFSTLIIVEGIDEERRRRPLPLEQRFAQSLLRVAPPPNPMRITAVIGDQPACATLPSTHVPFGGIYNPHGFCP